MEEKEQNKDEGQGFEFFRKNPASLLRFPKIPRWLKLLFALLALSYFMYYSLGGSSGLVNYARYKHYERRLRQSLAMEHAKTDSLKALIEKLQNDPSYIEAVARERLNMIKPGEKMIIFKEHGETVHHQDADTAIYGVFIDSLIEDSLAFKTDTLVAEVIEEHIE